MGSVISLEFDPDKIPATPRHRKGYCCHSHVTVCEKTRMLECQNCGAIIDPFDFMWEWACKDRNLQYVRKELKKDIERLSTQLKELKRQERNTKARIRRVVNR